MNTPLVVSSQVNRTDVVKEILASQGRMFTVTWKTKGGKTRTLNGKLARRPERRKSQDKIYGYITVMTSGGGGEFRRIDTRTISQLSINQRVFRVR
jgi:hypothetical protein